MKQPVSSEALRIRYQLMITVFLKQESAIVLLDDPLSAVDAHVAEWLLRHAICGPLMEGRTRVLSTHHRGVSPCPPVKC